MGGGPKSSDKRRRGEGLQRDALQGEKYLLVLSHIDYGRLPVHPGAKKGQRKMHTKKNSKT